MIDTSSNLNIIILTMKRSLVFLSMILFVSAAAIGATRYSVANGNWSSTTTWSATSGGAGGASVPTSGDVVIIERGYTVTVNISNAACSSLTLGGASRFGNRSGTLTFLTTGTPSLTVSGSVQVGAATNNASNGTITFTNVSSLICNSLVMGNATTTAASTADMTNGGTLTINGSLTALGNGIQTWTPGTGSVIFGATNSLPANNAFTSFNNLTISAGATTLTMATYTMNGALVINTGATFISSNLGTVNLAGNFSNSGAFTANSGNVILNGGGPQTIAGSSTSIFYNLTVNNANGLTLNAPVSVGGTLTLTSGIVATSSTNPLTITNTSTNSITGASSSSYINGPLAMTFLANISSDGTTYPFPVGDASNYRPIGLVNIRTGVTSPVVQVTENPSGATTGDGSTITSVNSRNWYVQTISGNFTSATIQLTESGLVPRSIIGESTAQSGVYSSIGGSNIGPTITSAQIVSAFPVYFAIGLSPVKPLYSYQSGDWNSTTTWTTDPSGTIWTNARIPGISDSVIILNGRTISVSSNNQSIDALTLKAGGILDIQSTTGHNFGTVSGQGYLKLSSNNFPGGTYTSFVASGGGTVEYYNLNGISLSTSQLTYDNLVVSNYSTSANTVYLNNFANPATYTVNGNFSLKNYSTGSNTFYFGGSAASDNLINMTVYGNFSVDPNCNIRVSNFATGHTIPDPTNNTTPYPVHTLNLYGNLTNNGSIRFTGLPSPVANAYYTLGTTAYGQNYGDVQVFFYGASNNTITCNGTTDFFRLIVAKGNDNTYTLEVTSSNVNNFALYAPDDQGNNTFNGGPEGYGYGAYYKALFIHYGTLKLDANINIPSLTEGGQDFNVIPTAGLWINGANVSTTISGLNGTGYQAATLYGFLRISSGQFSTGDAAGIVFGTLGTPTITIEGTGVLDVSQAWASAGTNLMSYIQTGGTANFRLQGENHAGPMLGLNSPNASFVMSGGTINFTSNTFVGTPVTYNYNIMDLEPQTGYYQVTGGTVNINVPASGVPYTILSTVPFYNLTVGNGSNIFTVRDSTSQSIYVLNNFTVSGGAAVDLNAHQANLFVGGNFTLNGTYTPATGAANVTTFNGTGTQYFYNAGTITNGYLTNLTITNSSNTYTVSNNLTVNGTLTIDNNSVLNDSGKVITVNGNVVINGTHTSSLTTGGITLSGTAAQTISGNGSGAFNNLTLNKTGGSVTVTANIDVNGNLRLAGGTAGAWNILNIGSNNLTFGPNAMVYSDMATGTAFANNRMIQTSGNASDGGVTKTFSNTAAFLFPYGFGTYYLPASIQYSSAPTTYGSVTTRAVNARHPLAQGTNNALTCYWKTSSAGFAGVPSGSVKHSYYFTSNFVQGTESSYIPAYYDGVSSWVTPAGSVDGTNNIVLFTALNGSDGDFTAGLSSAFVTIPTLYSFVTGNWNNAATWSTNRNTYIAGGTPTSSTLVYVCNGKTVTTTAAASAGSLVIETGATLDLGTVTGHNFGAISNSKVSGNGKLRIAATNYFPTGDWGSFLGSNGGIVEYYQKAAGTLNLPLTYSLPGSGTANITSYCNLMLSPYNGSNIILPNTNLTVYKDLTVGYSAGGGTANCVTQINPGATTTTLTVQGVIWINQYGILQYMNGTANIPQNVVADSDINIASGGALQVRNGGNSVANTLTVYGNLSNNGVLNLDPNTATNTYYSSLQFAGTNSKSLSGSTATQTQMYSIIVNKGTTLDSLVNVVINTAGFQMGGGGLSIQNGTFRLTSPVTMSLSSSGFTIPVTGGLSANGGTFNMAQAASGDLTLKGRLEVLAGSVNVGPSISSSSTISASILYSAAGSPTIYVSGGSLNVYSQIRRDTLNNSGSLNYTQTGGMVTIGGKNANSGRAAFEDLNSGSSFSMSGGTLVIAGGNINTVSPYDMDIEPDVSNVTGGTIQLGLSGVTANQTTFRFETSVPLWNVTLDSVSNAIAVQEVYNSTISGTLAIRGTTGYYNANGLDLEIGANLINNNTDASTGVNVGGFQAQSLTQTTSFLGTGDQTIIGTSSNRTNFANLEIATASGHTTFLSSGACTIIVNSDLTLTSGTLNDGGNSIYLLGNVNNNAIHLSPNPTAGGMIFAGAANQGMTGSGSGIFGNIEINNGGNGVNMTDNSTVNGQIKFTNGYLYIDDYALTLGVNATFAGTINASNLIMLNGVLSDKGVTKIFPSGSSTFTFPIGDNGEYTPVAFNFSSNSNPSGAIKVIPVAALHPSINPDSVLSYLNYYWYVSTTGFTSSYRVTQTYTYNPADTVGTPSHIERYDNSASTWSTVGTSITPPTFTFTDSTFIDGSYTIGDAFKSLAKLFSFGSGSWFRASLWSIDSTTMVAYGNIPKGNPVVIRAQDSVALDSNSANAASVAVYGVLDAENTTFHNLGEVSGNGKIKISSTSSGYFAFPGGTYDAFFANPASTVEFYGNISGRLPLDPGNTTKPYQNVIFSGNSTKYISSVDTKVVGKLTIQNGSKLDDSQYNKNIYVLGDWIDNNSSVAGFNPGTGTVYFSDSSVAQHVVMASGAMTETFYNFAVDNPSGVTITTGSVSVSSQLYLTSGNINTNASDSLIITNTDTNAVVGGGVNSFVNGPLKKQILNGSNFQFPVGDAVSSSRNRFGYVSVTGTSTSGTWTAQFLDKNPTTDGYNISNMTSPVKSVNYTEYWKITGPTGGTANVVLSWDQYSGMSSSLSTRALSLVAEWGTPVGNSWNSVGNTISDFGQDSGTVATSTVLNLAGTQVFTLGASTAAIAALITSIQTGLWNNASTWNVGRVPSSIDTVVIASPYTVALNTTPTISRFAVNNGGTYNDSTFTLNVTGNVTLNGTWTGSGKLSMKTSGSTLYGTGAATGTSTLEVAAGSENVASSANVTLKNVSILSGDTLNNYGSVTIDSVSGADTTSILNNLPGATLTINRSLLVTGTLNAAMASNTVVYAGSLGQTIKPTTYNNVLITGSGAKNISSGTTSISNGNLELRPGPIFTIGSGATVTTTGTGEIVLDTSSSYINLSSSTPLIQARTEFKGQDEWRMLAAPDVVTVGSMFASPFVTQGFTGSTYPSLQPNLLWWDETSQGTSLQAWRQPSTGSDTVKLGRGYMYYVFNGTKKADSSGSYSDTLPLTMSALGVEQPLTSAFNFGVTATPRSGGGPPDTTYTDTAAADFGWNLIGNPTPSTINWNAASGWTKTNIDGTIYIWDPADTTGGYKTWNGTTGNLGSGLIAPFQAFWVKANNINPVLSCDNGVKSSGGIFLGKTAQSPNGGTPLSKMSIDTGGRSSAKTTYDTASSTPVLSMDLSANGLHAQAYLMFSPQGKITYDPYDAFSLVPLSSNYLIFYSVAGGGQPAMQIQDLPDTGFADPFALPLYVGGTVGGKPLDGTFTLSWNLQGKLPDGWQVVLMDDNDSKAYTLSTTGELTFQYNTPTGLIPSSSSFLQKTTMSPGHRTVTALPQPVVLTVPSAKLSKAASVTPRFRLVISADNMSGYLPSTPQLAQNYPNPFNPSTHIQFSLPASAKVSIDIFNILGQRVTTLANEEFSAGTHTLVWNPRNEASGVYFCRMLSGSNRKIIKMLFLK